MSSELSIRADNADLPLLRWTGLSLLLLAELLYLTIRFDSATLAGEDGWWARLIEHSHIVPQLLIVGLTATLIFGGKELWSGLEQVTQSTTARHRWWPWCIAQVGVFAVFVPLTALVFERQSDPLWLGPLLWGLAGLVIVTLWGCAMLPPSTCAILARQHGLLLLGGLIVGAVGWAAGQFADSLWLPLGQSTLWLVSGLLNACGAEVVSPGNFVIGTSNFPVFIAPACSGYEGIGLAWVFVGAYLWWSRHELRWPNAWLLLPLVTGLMWLSNGVRIASLILIGSYGWRDVALGGFHSQAGWLAFNAIALGLVATSRHSRFFSRTCSATVESHDTQPTAAYLMPLIALVATLMVTSAFSSGVDWLYPLRVVTVGGVLVYYARHYAKWDWSWSWLAASLGLATGGLWIAMELVFAAPAEPSVLPANLATIPAGWAAVWLVFRVIGSVIAVPFAEELAFRGYLTRRLISADWNDIPTTRFSWFSLLVSSALFGALHPGRWLAGTLAGVLFAIVLYRRGNVLDAVVAHAAANALIAAYVLSTGSWGLWS